MEGEAMAMAVYMGEEMNGEINRREWIVGSLGINSWDPEDANNIGKQQGKRRGRPATSRSASEEPI